MNGKHAQLQDTAIAWLYGRGCSIFAKEVPTGNGIADALGIITRDDKEVVYYIEAKASRSDLVCKKQKLIYRNSMGEIEPWCWEHDPEMYKSVFEGRDRSKGWENCPRCIEAKKSKGDTGVDFYYLIVADGVSLEPCESWTTELYPGWGIINESGKVIRKARRMKRERDAKGSITAIAHVLVYKVFGKLYAPDSTQTQS